MYLETYAVSLLAEDLSSTAPGFAERLRIVAGLTERRDIAQPYYLTDLGVRRFEDPAVFFEANLQLVPGRGASRLDPVLIEADAANRTDSQFVDEVDASLKRALDAEEISEGDRRALSSVVANLRALACVLLGDSDGSHAEVRRARELMTLEGLDRVDRSEAARYTAQENINIAQVLALRGEYEHAVQILLENDSFCAANAPEYRSESLTALAYGHFLAGNQSTAIAAAKDALSLLATEATPVRLAVARRILVGALYESGQEAEANQLAEEIDSDPVGLALIRRLTNADLAGEVAGEQKNSGPVRGGKEGD